MSVRTFIALELSDALKEGILSLVADLKDQGVRASWARSSTMHLTLRFLGDVEETLVRDVVEAVRASARTVPEFAIATSSVGAFPSPRRPRVLWVGVEATSELYELQEALERELAARGFPRERRRFHPHVTVGRLREQGVGDLSALLGALDPPRETVAVRDVMVMKSTLAPGGARHERLACVPLSGAGGTQAPR